MRAMILGAGGQLGHDVGRAMGEWDLVPLRHEDLEISDYAEVRKALAKTRPDIVINAAAYVAVDDCEDQIERAFNINAFAVRYLALFCAELDCTLVQISSDYVFDGQKQAPYLEDDPPNPLNVYGASKLTGEYFVRNLCPKHFVVRSSGLYGMARTGADRANFVEKMLQLAKEGRPIQVVDDQVISPTYSRDLAAMLVELLNTHSYGLYHLTNSGTCSWFEFAAKIFEFSGLNPDFGPISSVDYGAKAFRPTYSVLGNLKSQREGLDRARSWKVALHSYLEETQQLGRIL